MSETPTFTYDWRLKEHAHVVGLLMRERLESRWWRALRWFVGIVLVAANLSAAASLLAGDVSSAASLLSLGLVVLALIVWLPVVAGWLRAWQTRRMDPAVHHPISVALEASGLRILTKKADTYLHWEELKKVRETPEFFMFYYSPRVAFYLPKRVLRGEAEPETVRAFIQDRLPLEVPFQTTGL